jgi:ribosomal protein L37AE/L43A
MSNTITNLEPGRNGFPEDFTKESLEKSEVKLFTCRNCRAHFYGVGYRRTCAQCVRIFQKGAQQVIYQRL